MTIRVDNGPEFVAEARADWVSGTACCGASSPRAAPEQPLERALQPERPEHILDGYPFESLDEVRDAAWTWLLDYAKKRSHDAPQLSSVCPRCALPTRYNSDHAFEAESSLQRINGCGDARRADPFG